MNLLDTNIIITASKNIEPVASFVRQAIEKNDLILSPIVIAEFSVKASLEETEKLDLLIDKFKVVPIDTTIARQAALYRKQSIKKNTKVYLLDCFLAATAKVHNLTLVTHNTQDFPMKDIKIFDPLSLS